MMRALVGFSSLDVVEGTVNITIQEMYNFQLLEYLHFLLHIFIQLNLAGNISHFYYV